MSNNCIGFTDYTKILAEYSNKGFTAQENCWARITSTSGWTNTTLNVNSNGVIIQQIQVNGITAVLYPMRKW